MKSSTIVSSFKSPVEKVWNIVTDNTTYNWRSDLSKIIVSEDQKCFFEFTKDGFQTKFSITVKKPYEKYEFDINNKNITGHWTGMFFSENSGTRIEFTEEITAKNPIMNLFISSFLKKQQNLYIIDLKKALGE
ncbi:MAG: polyketide cyclase [Clostridia bacterium]